MKKIPVILDTDIGNDVDDVWALVMLLKSPEVDIRLITTGTNNTIYRARLVAKLLEIAERTDIPIGVGIPLQVGDENHGDVLPLCSQHSLPPSGLLHRRNSLLKTNRLRP